jgi:hypothetical protein
MAGLTRIVANARVALQVLNSVADALAVYVLMAALTCAVELEMHGSAWFVGVDAALQG